MASEKKLYTENFGIGYNVSDTNIRPPSEFVDSHTYGYYLILPKNFDSHNIRNDRVRTRMESLVNVYSPQTDTVIIETKGTEYTFVKDRLKRILTKNYEKTYFEFKDFVICESLDEKPTRANLTYYTIVVHPYEKMSIVIYIKIKEK